MPHELESLRDQMDRLEHQLRWFKIAAVVLAVLAMAFALAPRSAAQQADATRVRQLIVEDAEGRPRVVHVEPAPGFDAAMVLQQLASVERASEHPLAAAIVAGPRRRPSPIRNPKD